MTSINIFLDDLRRPREAYSYTGNKVYLENEWVVCKNYKQFVNTIKDAFVNNVKLDIVSLDHDLDNEHYQDLMSQSGKDNIELHYDEYENKTGYDCLRFLLEFCSNENLRRPIMLLHTMNPVGKENMKALLANTKQR